MYKEDLENGTRYYEDTDGEIYIDIEDMREQKINKILNGQRYHLMNIKDIRTIKCIVVI